MKHYIVTRLALKQNYGNFEITKPWVDERIKLLKTWCYNSIKNQTCNNFEWIIVSTKEFITEEQLKTLKSFENSRIKNILIEENTEIKAYSSLTKHILKEELGNHDYKKILTTRLDSDDCISTEFVKKIQEISEKNKEEEDYVINFPLGYVYNIKRKGLTKRKTPWPNMFTTLVANVKDGNFDVLQGTNHTRMKRVYKVIDFEKGIPMWLQTVNETNITTRGGKNNSSNKKDFIKNKNFEYMRNLVK